MGLLDEAVRGKEAMSGGRLRTEDGENIKEGFPVGVPKGISDDEEDGGNRSGFLCSDRRHKNALRGKP